MHSARKFCMHKSAINWFGCSARLYDWLLLSHAEVQSLLSIFLHLVCTNKKSIQQLHVQQKYKWKPSLVNQAVFSWSLCCDHHMWLLFILHIFEVFNLAYVGLRVKPNYSAVDLCKQKVMAAYVSVYSLYDLCLQYLVL